MSWANTKQTLSAAPVKTPAPPSADGLKYWERGPEWKRFKEKTNTIADCPQKLTKNPTNTSAWIGNTSNTKKPSEPVVQATIINP